MSATSLTIIPQLKMEKTVTPRAADSRVENRHVRPTVSDMWT
jgi:hypothetical protein